jgi:hypothetical protein
MRRSLRQGAPPQKACPSQRICDLRLRRVLLLWQHWLLVREAAVINVEVRIEHDLACHASVREQLARFLFKVALDERARTV